MTPISLKSVILPAGCHGNLPVLNLLSASVARNQHFRPCRKNYALDRKMVDTCHDLLYHRAKFGVIKLCAPAVNAKIWCFLIVTFGLPARGDIV